MTQKHPMNLALTFWVKAFYITSGLIVIYLSVFVTLNKVYFSITAAFHMQKEAIHLETCCITGKLDMLLALIGQTLQGLAHFLL